MASTTSLPFIMYLFFLPVLFAEDEVSSKGVSQEGNKIPIFNWVDGTKAFNFKRIRKLKTPVLIQGNLPSKVWTAFKKWKNNDYLAKSCPRLTQVCVRHLNDTNSDSSFTYYDMDQPIYDAFPTKWKKPFEIFDMSMGDFLQNTETGNYLNQSAALYYSSNLYQMSQKLFADIHPFDPMGPKHFNLMSDDRLPVNVWMSSPGSSARNHYDSSSNLFIQVRGTKRFLLIDSRNWDKLYLFSHLHPLTRHSQAVIADESTGFSMFPEILDVRSPNAPGTYQVDLKPGDVLHIPAFYFHEVMVMPGDVSISLNSYVNDKYKKVMEKIMKNRIPMKKKFSVDLKEIAGYFYLREMVKQFSNKVARNDPTLYLRNIVSKIFYTRWQHAWRDPVIRDWIMLPNLGTVICPDRKLSDLMEWDNIQDMAEPVGELFQELPARARTVLFAEYIEQVANTASTDLRLVSRFLRRIIYCGPSDFGYKRYH